MGCYYDRHLWRQLFILSTGCLYSITAGVMFAHTGVLNTAILSANTTDVSATPDEASWMAASTGFSGIVGFFILTPIFQTFGRKPVHICMGIVTLLGWIMLSSAKSVTVIFAARILQGISFGGVFILTMTIAEYAHTKRRGYFVAMKKTALALGSLFCHSLSLIWTWRQIAFFAVVTSTISTISILFWPETPAFLAMVGRFDQCKKSYFWLNDRTIENTKELQDLITTQSRNIQCRNTQNKSLLQKLNRQLLKKDFLKPCIILALVSLTIDSCGRFFLLAYITQIIVKATGNNYYAIYCSIGLDVLLILAVCVSSVLVNNFNRRALLFLFGFTSAVLMFLIGLLAIFQSNNIVENAIWHVPAIILLHAFVSHVGLIPLGYILSSELFPLEHKGLGACVSGVIYTSLYAFTMKLTPVMLDRIGIEGTYATYGIIVASCLSVLFFILPETKDKTLLQIENEFKGIEGITEDNRLILLRAI